MSLLAEIIDRKEREVASWGPEPNNPFSPRPVVPWLTRASGGALHLLTEIKYKSPSAGELSRALTVSDRAHAYAACGARMISVLCDEHYFAGAYEHLTDTRCRIGATFPNVRILAKEFVISERQIERAARMGADSILLIARITQGVRLHELLSHARAHHMEPLVEVATQEELADALTQGARIVGVNARDLETLAIDVDRAARVLTRIPRDVVGVHLSGLKTAEDVRKVAVSRADAALIGEALMRLDDPRPLLLKLCDAACANDA